MRRVSCSPRPNWQEKVEQAGLLWHSGEQPYWDESAFYSFSAKEVDELECATNELAAMALCAAQRVIDEHLYSQLAIPEHAIDLIERSWRRQEPSLYGRFDLAYDGMHPPKLLEYNADTPTSLLEAAVVQWYWLEELFPACDQFNSIHERLIARWKEFDRDITFCSMDDMEDATTVKYLLDTAQQAGLDGSMLSIGDVGWNGAAFVDREERPLGAVFKLYPWEWMVREEFGKFLNTSDTMWIEPAWKMLLSNKGILPILWEMYPDHPNLLRASFDSPGAMTSWVRKPLLGREGANITLHIASGDFETGGAYGQEGFVYQEAVGMTAVIGSWVIGQESAGIGVRESNTPIVTNTSRFVPHSFD